MEFLFLTKRVYLHAFYDLTYNLMQIKQMIFEFLFVRIDKSGLCIYQGLRASSPLEFNAIFRDGITLRLKLI